MCLIGRQVDQTLKGHFVVYTGVLPDQSTAMNCTGPNPAEAARSYFGVPLTNFSELKRATGQLERSESSAMSDEDFQRLRKKAMALVTSGREFLNFIYLNHIFISIPGCHRLSTGGIQPYRNLPRVVSPPEAPWIPAIGSPVAVRKR